MEPVVAHPLEESEVCRDYKNVSAAAANVGMWVLRMTVAIAFKHLVNQTLSKSNVK